MIKLDEFDLLEELTAITKLQQEEMRKVTEKYLASKDSLVEESIGLKKGKVYRYKKGGRMDYRGYYRGIKGQEIHLETCLSDGTLTGKHFFVPWIGAVTYIKEVEISSQFLQ